MPSKRARVAACSCFEPHLTRHHLLDQLRHSNINKVISDIFLHVYKFRTSEQKTKLQSLASCLFLLSSPGPYYRQRPPTWSQLIITGLHILHYNGVLDAYGHVSVRNPNNGSNFFMSRNLAPALVANSSDLVEYYVEDAAPVDPNAPGGFLERYIHSELYKRFPNINSVVHSHSPQVVPYTFSGVPLRPTLHMAGFLGMHRNIS
jgi:hypothetical protein